MSIKKNKLYLSKCDGVANVIYINAELPRYGHEPFQVDCNGVSHGNAPEQRKRYLRKKISTSETSGDSATEEDCHGTITALWTLDKPDGTLKVELDPFTGLTQESGDVGFVSSETTISSDEDLSCVTDTVTTRKVFHSGTYTKCDGSSANRFTEIEFEDENTDAKLSTNVDSFLDHFTIFDTDVIPEYNTFVDVIPGTDGVQSRSGASVSSMPKTEPWRAKHFVDQDGINKSRLYIKFLDDTVYTEATGSYEDDGTVSDDYSPVDQGTVKTASSGDIITIDPPSEKNTFVEIHVCQHLTVCSKPDCNITIKGTEANEVKKSLPTPDCTGCDDPNCGPIESDCECACVFTNAAKFVGTDDKRYAKKTSTSSSSLDASIDLDFQSDTGEQQFLGGCSEATEENPDGTPESNDLQRDTLEGSASISGTKSSSNSSVDNTCTEDPDPTSSSSDYSITGSITHTITFTDRVEPCPTDEVTEETNDPDTIADGDFTFNVGVSNFSTAPLVVPLCSQNTTAEIRTTLIRGGITNTSDPDTATVVRTISATANSITSTAEMTGSVTEPVVDVSSGNDAFGNEIFIRGEVEGSIEGTATTSIVLSDKLELEGNYTVTIIPKTDVPKDDPSYDDGVRDGTLTEVIDYAGITRSHVDLTSVTFDVTTIPNTNSSLNHKSYLNFLISKLDNTDPNHQILSHETTTEFLDQRKNNPLNESDQWTITKKINLSIDVGDVDGNTASITKYNCFSIVEPES